MAGISNNLTQPHSDFVISEETLQEFKTSYLQLNGQYELEAQVPYLVELANGYRDRYQKTDEWTDMLKSHTLFNAVGSRCPNDDKWIEEAFEVQKLYWRQDADINIEMSQQITTELKQDLNNIRVSTRNALLDADKLVRSFATPRTVPERLLDDFFSLMQNISVTCTDRMIDFAAKVFHHSANVLSQSAPCDYCVVALGSMAKGECTPYSDLEYLFLVERNDDETAAYFKKLAITGYLIIGNLKETGLDGMAIAELKDNKWFKDRQKNGFKIDGLGPKAGNIPTGNGISQNNCFITTPLELLEQYKNVLNTPDPEKGRIGDMSALLQYTRVIFSPRGKSSYLLQEFQQSKSNIVPNPMRREINEEMFKSDAREYDFRPDPSVIERAYCIDPKVELYRYPSMLLYNTSLLVGCNKTDSWETLSMLRNTNQISPTVHRSLKFLLACACYVRLSTYLFHDSQDNRLSVLEPYGNTPITQQTHPEHGARWYLSNALFVAICDHAVPLKDHIRKCEEQKVDIVVRMEISCSSSWLTKFQTYYCSHQWEEAWNTFKLNVGQISTFEQTEACVNQLKDQVSHNLSELWFIVKALGSCLRQQRKYGVALNFHLVMIQVLDIPGQSITEEEQNQLLLADVYDEVGTEYIYFNSYEEAETEYNKSLNVRINRLSVTDKLVGKSHYNIGRALRLQMKLSDAEIHLVKALHIYDGSSIKLTKDKDLILNQLNNSSVMLGHVLRNLGYLYFTQKWYNRAFNYFLKTWQVYEFVYGKIACHQDMAECLLALGCSNDMLGNYTLADQYFRKAIRVIIQLYKPRLTWTLRVADVFGNKLYYKAMFEVFLKLPGFKVEHVETAATGRILAYHLICMKLHSLAEEVMLKMKRMYLEAAGPNPRYGEVGRGASNLGFNAWKAKRIDNAIAYFKEAMEMLEKDDSQFSQLEAAETLQNMGLMYAELKNNDLACEYLLQAKDRYRTHCGDENHPKLTEIEEQIRLLQTCIAR